MMNDACRNGQIKPNIFFNGSEMCLFELTDSGTILYYRDNCLNYNPAEFVGRNLFEEIAPFENTDDLRRRLNHFVKSEDATQKFAFDCRINDEVIPTKIMLVRVGNQTDGKRHKTIIVDIRKI